MLLAPGVSLVPSSLAQALPKHRPINLRQSEQLFGFWRASGRNGLLLDNTDISNFFNHGTGSDVAGTALGVDALAEFRSLPTPIALVWRHRRRGEHG